MMLGPAGEAKGAGGANPRTTLSRRLRLGPLFKLGEEPSPFLQNRTPKPHGLPPRVNTLNALRNRSRSAAAGAAAPAAKRNRREPASSEAAAMMRTSAMLSMLVLLALPASIATLPATTAGPFGWPFSWATVPTAMFGCNTSGLETKARMDFNARFGITIYEARTMQQEHGWTDTERWLQVQAAAMKAAHPRTPVFVYRSASGTDKFFASGAAILANRTRSQEWLLHFDAAHSGAHCGEFGCTDYDFRNPEMAEYFLNTIIPEVAAEPNLDGVFFDDCDTVVGGARSGAWLSAEARAEVSNASLPVLAKAFHALNAVGKTPMWSSGRTFAGIEPAGVTRWSPAASFPPGAAYTEEAAIEAFGDAKYYRYYEFWQWQAGAATCGAQIQNALLEQQHGIPIVAITPSCPKPKHQQGGNGPCGGHVPTSMDAFFNFSMAAFLVVASPYSYWGFQNSEGGGGGWFDNDKTWHSLYDVALVRVPSRSISPPWGVGSISSSSPHVRPMWALSTCGVA